VPVTRRAVAVAVVLLCLAAGACDLQTAGAPKGNTTLYAEFDDVQHLVRGHAVKVADVQVGTVTDVSLDGIHHAKVTMSIVDGRRIPDGTTATLAQTSLLGENYVQLEFPDKFDPDTGPFLASGSMIEHTGVEPTLEHVTEQAIDVIGSVQTGDLAAIVDSLATGFGGRGAELHQLIQDLDTVTSTFAGQSNDITRAIDGLAQLGHDLAASSDQLGLLIGNVDQATQALSAQRQRIVDALARVTDLATALNQHVLEPHSAQLDQVLQQLAPVAASLAQSRDTIGELLDNLEETSVRGGHATDSAGAVLIYAWITGVLLPGGQVVHTSSGADAINQMLDPTS
jgi:phospholipid/cholesterol/gamma-HCH transport system substrate-binding protein